MRTALVVIVVTLLAPACARTQTSLVNFDHLERLTERIVVGGDSVAIVHVYANAPDYRWVDAKESGPEGIACVDDAGRAAVTYLRHYELTKSPSSLARAKELLRFVLKMQAGDGRFNNFIFADHTINTTGTTSATSFGWWAARGVWGMAEGYRLMRTSDRGFAERLRRGIELSLPHVEKLTAKFGAVDSVSGFRIPRWLLYGSGADATTELTLGLLDYYAAAKSRRVKDMIEKFAEGFIVMQDGDASTFPYGLHRSWETMWHMWGNSQTAVLARAGRIFGKRSFTLSAEREAVGFYSRLLVQGFLTEMDLAKPGKNKVFDQIAYGVRPMTLGLLRLFDATGKREYLVMAGLAGSWFFGNNPAGLPMYDPGTGRCYDGIRDSVTINRNSGAESTVEALLTLIELEHYPDAVKYVYYRKTAVADRENLHCALFRNGGGEELTLVLDTKSASLLVLEGPKSAAFRAGMKDP